MSKDFLQTKQTVLAGAAIFALAVPAALSSPDPDWPPVQAAHYADFGDATPSFDARSVADWIADSNDAGGGPFVIVDKKQARLYVFDADSHLRASSAVLLGAARGDKSLPGSISRPIDLLRREERITPAGRFVASRGRNLRGEDIVWVAYDESVSMHRVLTAYPKERRLERLSTPTPDDNRISYGCINLPAAFYEAHIRPMFASHDAVVYVLPEAGTVQQVFGAYNVAASHLMAN